MSEFKDLKEKLIKECQHDARKNIIKDDDIRMVFDWLFEYHNDKITIGSKWRTIDSAPRDVPILGCVRHNGCIDILQLDCPVDWRYLSMPDLWMPLPQPPKGDE